MSYDRETDTYTVPSQVLWCLLAFASPGGYIYLGPNGELIGAARCYAARFMVPVDSAPHGRGTDDPTEERGCFHVSSWDPWLALDLACDRQDDPARTDCVATPARLFKTALSKLASANKWIRSKRVLCPVRVRVNGCVEITCAGATVSAPCESKGGALVRSSAWQTSDDWGGRPKQFNPKIKNMLLHVTNIPGSLAYFRALPSGGPSDPDIYESYGAEGESLRVLLAPLRPA